MLTEQEREWLERRKNLCSRCEFCLYDNPCIKYGKRGASGVCPGFYSTLCAEYNFEDAAEFEARVAVLLAKDRAGGKTLRPKGCSWYETTEDGQRARKNACPPRHDIDNCPGFAMCSLYHARLAAEAEMGR
ncbi:hypothetical protein [uncultured Desulfovibrio sp.]|uniref:hypothetical protein n=1 Tax=uncultured Desulfovibrio sp. TaxID=167968 RepID=UPI002604BDE2|nr:hypothetical protein [uncultured Desulfovibrio sp.]